MKDVNTINNFYSLVPLEEFKSVLCIDDREDKLCRFCLVTTTLTIESYCKRKIFLHNHNEHISFYGDLEIPLREYPVTELKRINVWGRGEVLEPQFYNLIPDSGTSIDIPFSVELSPVLGRVRWLRAIHISYMAGYEFNAVPADLEAACLEMAAWNMGRYRGKRIGMTGSVRKDGDRWEMAMPENVRGLLEPYRRKVI